MHSSLIQAENLYTKDSQIKREDVKILQEWLSKQPHLPEVEDWQVILFLHSCYYSIEASKTTIDAYFTRRTLHPETFFSPSEDMIRSSMRTSFVQVLPKRTPEGYTIFILKLLDFKPDNYSFLNDARVINLVVTLDLYQQGFSNGWVGIFDFKGFTLRHLAKLSLTLLKQGLDHLQQGAPLRIKHAHFVNAVPFMDKFLGLLKPLMDSELYNLIELHSSIDSLHKCIPKECLPEELDGQLASCRVLQEGSLKNILDNFDFLKWHDTQQVDESKRIEKSNSISSGFGAEGTFKKLELD